MDTKKLLNRIEELVNNESNDWSCLITKVENGFIIKQLGYETNTTVIEEPEEETGELIAMEDLLWNIKDIFGCHNSKHNKHNIEIGIIKNKFE